MEPPLAVNIRAACRRLKLTHAEFIRRAGIAEGTFYALLRGEPPKKIVTVDKLRAAGVVIPRDLSIVA